MKWERRAPERAHAAALTVFDKGSALPSMGFLR